MNTLRRYLHLLAYLFLTVPLVVAPFFVYQYVFTQVHLTRLIAGLSLMPLLVLWLWRGRPRIGIIAGSFLAYVLGLAFLNVRSINRILSYGGVWERFGSVIDWAALGIFLLLLITMLRTSRAWKLYLRVLVLIATIVALIGIAQKWPFLEPSVIESRIFSTVGNPLFLTGLLLLSTGLTLYASYTDVKAQELYRAAVIVQVLAIALTITRSGLVGLASAGAVYLLLRFMARTQKRSPMMIVATVLAAFGIFFGVAVFMAHPLASDGAGTIVREELSGMRFENKTVTERVVNALVAWKGFTEHPISGWGTGAYGIVFQKYYHPALYFGSHYTGFFDYPHNQWLSVLVEVGVIGFMLWVMLGIAPLLFFAKRAMHDTPVRILYAFYAGYIIFLSFSFPSIADTLMLVVYVALFTFLSGEGVVVEKVGVTAERKSRLIAVLSVVIGLGFSFVISVKPVVANYLIRRSSETVNVSEKLHLLQRAVSVSPRSRRVAVDRLLAELPQIPTRPDQLPLYEFARSNLKTLIADTPYDVRYIVLLAKVYRSETEFTNSGLDQVELLLDRAIQLSSMDPELYQLRGLVRLDAADRLSEPAERQELRLAALDDFNIAFRLAPDVNESVSLFTMAQGIADGTFDEVRRHIMQRHASFRGADWELVVSIFSTYKDREGLLLIRDNIDRYHAGDAWFQALRRQVELSLSEITL